jgi:hypothetical protein
MLVWPVRYHLKRQKPAQRMFVFVTFPPGIIVAPDKYQPFVLPGERATRAKIVNK